MMFIHGNVCVFVIRNYGLERYGGISTETHCQTKLGIHSFQI